MLNPSKAFGPDFINPRLLKDGGSSTAEAAIIYVKCLIYHYMQACFLAIRRRLILLQIIKTTIPMTLRITDRTLFYVSYRNVWSASSANTFIIIFFKTKLLFLASLPFLLEILRKINWQTFQIIQGFRQWERNQSNFVTSAKRSTVFGIKGYCLS